MRGSELPAGSTVAGWRLLRLLGQGTHGSVYLAEGPAVDGAVALKLVPLGAPSHAAAAHEAFLHSAATGRRLVHPGIVALQAAGIEGSSGWLAMELVAGGDLGQHVHRGRLLPLLQVLQVAARMAQALAYAHGQGVVHRDLKPANVLVDWPGDRVKLADLGLARADDAAQTATGIVLGTPSYMAPEQLAGSVPTPSSDFYAFGAMLFQLLAGRLPHAGESMGELLRQVASQPAPRLSTLRPDVPAALDELVAELLGKRPEPRPANGERIALELQRIAGA